MIIVGSVEQHGYLSLATDTIILLKMAEAASKESGVLIAPPVQYGSSPYFLDYPGTLSISLTTLLSLVGDVIKSAHHQGFRKFLLLNGHGGNSVLSTFLYELANDLPGMKANYYSWWTQPVISEIAEKYGLTGNHANWMEAFPETIITDMPTGSKEIPGRSEIGNSQDVRKHYGDGSFGGRYQADQKVMDEIMEACTKEIINLLKFE